MYLLGQDEGGKLIYGGKKPEDLEKGWYFEPTIFEHTDNKSRITKEEILDLC